MNVKYNRDLIFRNVAFLLVVALHSCTGRYLPMRLSEIKINPDSSFYKIIPVPDSDLNQSLVLKNVCNSLWFNHPRTAKRYLRDIHRQDSVRADYYMASAIYNMSVNNYEAAQANLLLLQTKDYPFLRQLLTIDCNYELEKWQPSFHFDNYLRQYQKLLDENLNQPVIKKILLNHARYARYRM